MSSECRAESTSYVHQGLDVALANDLQPQPDFRSTPQHGELQKCLVLEHTPRHAQNAKS